MAKPKLSFDLQRHYTERLVKLNSSTPYVLRITEWKDKPMPVLIVKERHYHNEDERPEKGEKHRTRSVLIDRGNISGESLQRCLPVFQRILESVTDKAGVPLELQRCMTAEGLRLRGNLPLDEEAGAKLALICRLQDRLKDLGRVELIAHRVARFTREEAAYWLSRTTSFGAGPNRWALSGLKIMLGGHSNDPDVKKLLEHYRISA